MIKREDLQEEVKTLSDYIKQLEKRIKTLEQENMFLEALNIRVMQKGGGNDRQS
jgi:cell division protein FtsB